MRKLPEWSLCMRAAMPRKRRVMPRSLLAPFLVSVAACAFLFVGRAQAEPTTNTNACITDLGGIQACQERGLFGLPTDLLGCCDGVRQLAVDRCECSPALDLLLGEEGGQIYEIEPLCRFVQPLQWLKVPLRAFRDCSALESHAYGCERSDMEIDAARLGSVMAMGELFADAQNEAICLDTPAFVHALSRSFVPDISVTVPYGVGTYRGLEDVAEYLGMAFAALNHGFWQHDTSIDPTKPAAIEVSSDGSVWFQGATVRGSFLRGLAPYTDVYLTQEARFSGCQTRVSDFEVLPDTGIRFLAERYVQTSDLSKRWGLEDICRYHTEFCADDPETRQYESEEACLEYLGSLPLYTEACGPNRALSGHSISCKFKHHFMIPANPALHCPHIGPLGNADPHGSSKCDDVSECSEDVGQDAWPPVSAIGDATPSDLVELFMQSNEGYEDEPFGCAIPTAPGDHGPHP